MSPLLLFLYTLFYFAQNTHINNQVDIINGVPTSTSKYPWVVSLRENIVSTVRENRSGSICTGSLIQLSPPVILTAAHCFYHKIQFANPNEDGSWTPIGYLTSERSYFYADINRTYVNPDNGTYVNHDMSVYHTINSFYSLQIFVEYIFIHKKYYDSASGNDIALIIFKDKYALTTMATDIPLPMISDGTQPFQADEALTAIGYGRVNNDEDSHVLRSADMYYIDGETCINDTIYNVLKVYPDSNANITKMRSDKMFAGWGDKIICVKGRANKVSHREKQYVCNGDSGGPLFRSKDGRAEIVGVASFISPITHNPYIKLCNASTATKYTNASKYRYWVQGMIYNVTGGESTDSKQPVGIWIVLVIVVLCVFICVVIVCCYKSKTDDVPNVYTEIKNEQM